MFVRVVRPIPLAEQGTFDEQAAMQGLKGPEAELRLPELGGGGGGEGGRSPRSDPIRSRVLPIPNERKKKRERGAAVREVRGKRGEKSLVIRAKEGGLSLPAIRVC